MILNRSSNLNMNSYNRPSFYLTFSAFPVRRRPGFAAAIQMEFHRECTPQQNIIFTKTHKTGSSTITNILLRLVERQKCQLFGLVQILIKFRMRNFFWLNDETFAGRVFKEAKYLP